MKTALHEAFHAKGSGLKLAKDNLERWRYIEEAFAESASHYMLRSLGVKGMLSPSYAGNLIEVLPSLKKLDAFKNCKTMYDFGEIAYKYRFVLGKQTDWLDMYQHVKNTNFDWIDYASNYIGYIKKNKTKLLDLSFENMPQYKDVKHMMLKDIDNIIKKYDNKTRYGITLTSNEEMVFQQLLINAMNKKGIK